MSSVSAKSSTLGSWGEYVLMSIILHNGVLISALCNIDEGGAISLIISFIQFGAAMTMPFFGRPFRPNLVVGLKRI